MVYTFFFLTVVSATFVAATPTYPVCIVGAGPTGLTIANGLQAKGIETVIFDKNPEVGGKCQAYYDNGGQTFHPLGALLFAVETYRETLPLVNASGLPLIPYGQITRPWLYNWTTGDVHQSPASINETYHSIEAFRNEVTRFINYWNEHFKPYTALRYKNGFPDGYTMPTSKWLSENMYVYLQKIVFPAGMVPYGYGDMSEVPILYMLQYFTPDILCFFFRLGNRVYYFRKVFIHYAEHSVKGPKHLNTTIKNIDRSGDQPVVAYKPNLTTGVVSYQTCSKLVLAFPLVMHALEAANPNISEEERSVFSPVSIINYWSGAVSVNTTIRGPFVMESFEALGRPVAFLRLFDSSDIATTWSWGKHGTNQTLAEARGLLKETISKINRDPRDPHAKNKPITDADVKAFERWDYFAQYDSAHLKDGYAKFNRLQGKANTYYASGFNGFETVEFAIRAGWDIMNSFF